MKLKSLKELSTLTVKDLKEALNELPESYDNIPVCLFQSDSQGNSWGVDAVGTCVPHSLETEENPSFEIESSVYRDSDSSEEGLTPEAVFNAYVAYEKDEPHNIVPWLGYANLNLEDKEKVDQMIEGHNAVLAEV